MHRVILIRVCCWYEGANFLSCTLSDWSRNSLGQISYLNWTFHNVRCWHGKWDFDTYMRVFHQTMERVPRGCLTWRDVSSPSFLVPINSPFFSHFTTVIFSISLYVLPFLSWFPRSSFFVRSVMLFRFGRYVSIFPYNFLFIIWLYPLPGNTMSEADELSSSSVGEENVLGVDDPPAKFVVQNFTSRMNAEGVR